MAKKIALVVVVAALVALQCYLLCVLRHGAFQQFENTWQAFGTTQTAYSALVFRNLPWWWIIPVASCLAAGYALWRRSHWAAAVALAGSLVGSIGLLWALYAPALMVHV